MKSLHIIAFILLVVGGLNWLLVGLFEFDLVAAIFGAGSVLSRIIYILVGISAVLVLATHKRDCKTCTESKAAAPQAAM